MCVRYQLAWAKSFFWFFFDMDSLAPSRMFFSVCSCEPQAIVPATTDANTRSRMQKIRRVCVAQNLQVIKHSANPCVPRVVCAYGVGSCGPARPSPIYKYAQGPLFVTGATGTFVRQSAGEPVWHSRLVVVPAIGPGVAPLSPHLDFLVRGIARLHPASSRGILGALQVVSPSKRLSGHPKGPNMM